MPSIVINQQTRRKRYKKKSVNGSGAVLKSKYALEDVWAAGRAIPPVPEDLPEPKLSENALYIAKTRYALRNDRSEPVETAREMFWRVAYNIACAELLYSSDEKHMLAQAKDFYKIMSSQEFIPNTPTMLNAGKQNEQLSACFVLPIEDDMKGIAKTLVDMVLIHKSGGGTGFSFSRLRPCGDIIRSSGGTTVGPCSFLQAYNDVTSQVKQGGVRRGANMGILHITHPDILRFAVMKVDEFNLTNFNISVTVTEEWMNQVKSDVKFVEKEPEWDSVIEEVKEAQKVRDVDLKLKKTEDGVKKLYELTRATHEGEGYALINPRNGEVTEKLNAYKIFLLITKLAWQYGDPGMIMIDRINKSGANPTPELGQIEATNPCITTDTWVHTNNGPRQVFELVGTPFLARVDGKTYFSPGGFFKTGTKQVVKIETAEGYCLRLTRDHKVRRVSKRGRFAIETEWCEAGQLKRRDRVVLNNHNSNPEWAGRYTKEEGYLLGLLIGDGTLKKDKAILSVWPVASTGAVYGGVQGVMSQALQSALMLPHRQDFKGWMSVAGRREYRLAPGSLKKLAVELGLAPGKKAVTPAMEKSSSVFYKGFLSGLFDADGSVQGTQRKGVSIRLSQSNIAVLQTVQRMLLRLGIASSIYKQRRPFGSRMLPNGRGGKSWYTTRAQHELVISGKNLLIFAQVIGFADTSKFAKLTHLLNSYKRVLNREFFTARISSVTPDGAEDVYDVQIPGLNAFDANGFYVHNCGEQPLLPYDACTLGSINVGKFVRGGKLDFDGMAEVTAKSVRFLDNVLDMNNYPIPEIAEMTRNIRRIGLGVMGFADLLVQLGVGYNSEEGLALAEKVMGFIQKKAKEASSRLAGERGVFPAWKGSVFDRESPYFLGDSRPARNGAVTTIAPTGTISMLADASSGIEPHFALSFAKNTIEGKRLFTTNPFFLEAAQREGFYSEGLLEKIEEAGGSVRELGEVPDKWKNVFVTARDITPEWHVRMQAAFQKHVDNAISKTINFPNEATVEDVRRAYMMVYETGCKGITIYRDGSRSKQVLEVKKDKSYYDQLNASTAEEKDSGKVYANGNSGLANGHLGVGYPENGGPVKAPMEAWGMRLKKRSDVGNVYTAVFKTEDGRPVEVFINVGKTGGYVAGAAEVTGRLASLALKHGASLGEVASELIGVACGTPYGVGPNAILSMFDAAGKSILEISRNKQLSLLAGNGGSLVEQGTDKGGNGYTTEGPAASEGLAPNYKSMFTACPDCGSTLLLIEGCTKCSNPGCGYSKC